MAEMLVHAVSLQHDLLCFPTGQRESDSGYKTVGFISHIPTLIYQSPWKTAIRPILQEGLW